MRVALLPSDLAACGAYRVLWPAETVQAVRPDWEIIPIRPGDLRLEGTPDGQPLRATGLPRFDTLDLIVLQRVGSPAMANLIRWAQRAGVAVVMDNDDAMWCIDPANTAYHQWNAKRARFHWSWADDAAALADLNTVTTAVLARRYGPRVQVLPNRLPRAALEVERAPRQSDRPALGWIGQTQTHPHDPAVAGDAVRRAAADTGCRVVCVSGQQDALAAAWGLPAERFEQHTPTPLGEPYYRMLSTLDVALVPLADTPFNRGKSSLKALECAAMGAAVIASPTPANRELERSGVPILFASTPRQWHEHAVRLLRDDTERAERASVGRQVIAQDWTIEGNAEHWAQAWERAVARRRRLTPRTLTAGSVIAAAR